MAEIERKAIADPFAGTIQKERRLMSSNRAKPRSAFQAGPDAGRMIVDSLVNFAGVAGDIYVTETNKKIEADKIVQTARASRGAVPTNDATMAGKRAHSAVAIKSKMLKRQADLSDLAKKDLTDDQWNSFLSDAYADVDKEMMSEYEDYSTDADMQKIAALTFREMTPQLEAVRAGYQKEREIQGRQNEVADTMISMANLDKKNGMQTPPDVYVQAVDRMFGPLQLTQAQKEDAIVDAALRTQSPSLIAMTKEWKGKRKTSIYDRNGKIQALDKKLKENALINMGTDFEIAQMSMTNDFMAGKMTANELIGATRQLRAKSGNRYPPKGYLSTTMGKAQKAREEQAELMAGVQALIMGDTYKNKDAQNKEREAFFDKGMELVTQAAQDQARVEFPDDDQQANVRAAEIVGAKSKMLLQRSVEQGYVPNSIKDRLNQIATINLSEDGRMSDTVRDDGTIKERLSPETQTELTYLGSVPAPARQAILDSLPGQSGRVIEIFWNEVEAGAGDALALERAQRRAANPRPVIATEVQDAAKKITSELQHWFKTDYTDNQEGLVQRHIGELLHNSADPTAKATQERIKSTVDGYARTGSGRVFIGMSQQKAGEMIGINDPSHWDGCIETFIKSQSDRLRPILGATGMGLKDVTIMPVPAQGFFRLVDSSGALLSAKRFKFSDLASAYHAETYKKEKKLLGWKRFQDRPITR